MPNLITKQFKISNSKNFIEQFSGSEENSLYMFLAKPNLWGSENDLPIDPIDSQTEYTKIWDEMISLKRVSQINMINVVRRVNWVKNTIYAEYDHEDYNLLNKDFFVLNRDLDVYKCISNNNSAPSTIEPTGKNLNIFLTSDGYKWKYLYSISSSDKLKFLTDNWMPVRKNTTVAEIGKDGGIEHIRLYSGGIDYTTKAKVVITGDGTSANISAKQSLGVIYDFTYSNVGSKYRFINASIQDEDSPFARGANIKPIISPIGGHGSDPIAELGAHYVMINVRTEYNEGAGDFPGGFSYRKLGLIKNPKNSQGQVSNSLTLNGLVGISLSNVLGNFSNNEFIEGIVSKANAFVVTSNIVSGNGYVRYIQTIDLTNNFFSFNLGETVIGKTSGATGRVANILNAEVISDTGEILYIENRIPITKSLDQSESLHLVLEF